MDFFSLSGQERVKRILQQAFLKGRVPSAYLFIGPRLAANASTAIEYAKLVNCSSHGKVCGSCENCSKIERGIHPDVMVVSPEGSNISIDRIREIAVFTRYGPAFGRMRIVIVDQADYMSNEAHASFLKTLEEPAENVLFILITSRENLVPATVASRCQKVSFSDVETELTKEDADHFTGLIDVLRSSDEGQAINLWGESSDSSFDASFNGSLDAEGSKSALDKLMTFFRRNVFADRKKDRAYIEAVRTVSSCYRAIERKANLKLALDVMFLNLREVLNG